MSRNFADDHIVLNCSTDSVDFLDGTKNTDVYNMSGFSDAFFIVNLTTSDGTATHEMRIHSAPDVTPTTTHGCAFRYRRCLLSDSNSAMNTWTLATSSGFVTTAGDFQVYELWIQAEQLFAGDEYIFLNSTEIVNDPVGGSIALILTSPAYGREIAPNVLT
jgi:hypothetical protein